MQMFVFAHIAGHTLLSFNTQINERRRRRRRRRHRQKCGRRRCDDD